MQPSSPTSSGPELSSRQVIGELALTFDDVLLIPAFSSTLPSDASVATTLGRGDFTLASPILSAAMDTVTDASMAVAMAQAGGLGVIHKNMTIEAQAQVVSEVKSAGPQTQNARYTPTCDAQGRLRVAAATGVGESGRERAVALMAAGVDALVIDTAHGHSQAVISAVRTLRDLWPDAFLIAGNVATPEGTVALIEAGADAVKVGVGPGSICTTRQVAGVGVPQLTALLECAPVARARGCALIADGGIRRSGDIVKALAAGASAVMVGSLLARAVEAPGDTVTRNGQTLRYYRGMGSKKAMQAGSADRYAHAAQAGASDKRVAEGVEAWVPVSGSAASIVDELVGGLQAGMGYLGAPTLEALFERAKFVRITTAGVVESGVHDVSVG